MEHNTPKVPRNCNGDNSAIYIGKVLVVRPDARPTINRAKMSIITELAIRQKKNRNALTTNSKAHVSIDRFLKIFLIFVLKRFVSLAPPVLIDLLIYF